MKKTLCLLLVFLLLLSCFAGCSKEEVGVTRPVKNDKPETLTEPDQGESSDDGPAFGDNTPEPEPGIPDDEIYSAYLPVLKAYRDRILAYDWQSYGGFSSGRKVAFADVCGEDSIPEMVILCDAEGNLAGMIATLNIFTYRDGKVEQLFTGNLDGQVAGGCHYCLYTAEGELRILMGYTDENQEGSISRFRINGNTLETETLAEYCFVPDFLGYEAVFSIGGTRCKTDEFEAYLTAALAGVDTVLAHSSMPAFFEGTVEVSREKLDHAVGMSYADALDFVRARQKNPEIVVEKIEFELISTTTSGNYKESGMLSALAPDGTVVWSYKTAAMDATELTHIIGLGEVNDCYYMTVAGDVLCFDRDTGNLRWTNTKNCGAACSWAFDEGGRLYICGYYGPDLLVIDASGRTVISYDSVDLNHWWPYQLELRDGAIYITFDGTDDGKTLLRIDSNFWDIEFIE